MRIPFVDRLIKKSIVYDLPKEHQRISQRLEQLLDSNDKSLEYLSEVNSIQRELSGLAIHTYKDPSFFTEQRVSEMYDLLQRAAKYLSTSDYSSIASQRPDRFLAQVESMKQAAEAYQKIMEITERAA